MFRRASLSLAVLALTLAPLASRAQETDPAETLRQLQKLQLESKTAFEKKDYPAAQTACEEFLKILPNHPHTRYNLACALALQNKKDTALEALTQAVNDGFADPDTLSKDTDIASLREDKSFPALLEKTKANKKALEPKYEEGAKIDGLQTLEDAPEGGLRYRIRLSPDASEKKPAKLLIWLHPSGGSMNNVVEKLAPDFASRGFALVVFTQKQFMAWTPDEADALLNKTLPAIAKNKSIDASRPVLLGFSAGGQLALELYYNKPDAFSALLLDAAYPVAVKDNKYVPHDLPENKAALAKTPILALVGEKDGGAKLWQDIQPAWQKAGVPLTLEIVPNKPHTWLLTGDYLKKSLTWLEQIAAGKLPADAPATSTAPKPD